MLATLRWPDLTEWRGLPECTLAELAEVFTVSPTRVAGVLGEEHRALEWLTVSGQGFPDSIMAWLDGERVVTLDARIMQPLVEWQALKTALGAPTATLDGYIAGVLMKDSEWVYPERGLTLFVDPDPEGQALFHLTVYPKTTLSEYRQRYRFIAGKRIRY